MSSILLLEKNRELKKNKRGRISLIGKMTSCGDDVQSSSLRFYPSKKINISIINLIKIKVKIKKREKIQTTKKNNITIRYLLVNIIEFL